jgi:UDP-N-acetylglucosamine 4-epimerase
MLTRQPVVINGDGETSRDFCYVANVVQANLLAATVTGRDAVNQNYNVAVHARTSLNELYDLLLKRLAPRYPYLEGCKPVYHEFRAGDVRHSEADISKARRLLGYEPAYRIDQGMDEALDWYCQNLKDGDGR